MCASPSRLPLGTRLASPQFVRALICAAIALFPVWPGAVAKPGVSLPAGNLSQQEADLEIALALTTSELSRWNPAVADFCHVGCPACGEGKACGSDLLRWDVRRPFEIRCQHCGEIFPSSRFPNWSCTKIVAPDGTTQNYPYFRGSDGWPYYMDALILNRRREWLRRNALRLAAMFGTTGDPRYAEQSKAILLSFARNYDALPVHGSSGKDFHPTFFSIRPEAEPPSGVREVAGLFSGRTADGGEPYPKWSVRQGSHWYYREIPTELVLAYEQIRPVLSASDRAKIECFIRKTVNFARTFRVAQDNMTPGLAQREIFAGKAIGESEFVRGGVQRLHLLLQNRFYADGTWFEFAPSYFNQVYRSLTDSAQFLPGRPGEAGGAGGIEDAMPGLAAEWARIRQSLFAMRRPDGQLATVYDTWSTVTDPAYLWSYRTSDLYNHRRQKNITAKVDYRLSAHTKLSFLGSYIDHSEIYRRLYETRFYTGSQNQNTVPNATTRTSTLRGFWSPRRSISRSCSTRSSLAWAGSGRSPTSSRNSVPPSARSKRPGRADWAPV